MKQESYLHVQPGVEKPASINRKFIRKRKNYSADELIEGVLAGDRMLLSRTITLLESKLPQHEATAQEVLQQLLPHASRSQRIGITGVPGVGKSSFIEVFGKKLIDSGHKLAILAVDPTSQRSKGSILGDKTRMEELVKEPNCFIRPTPSGDSLGGVARKTREIIICCEAFGFDTILIETVGVGQSEVAVHSMVDFFLLLMLAGAGDELQGIKRGIMEMADLIAITKADGENAAMAKLAAAEYRSALHLFPPAPSGWQPLVRVCSAQEKSGIQQIQEDIWQYFTKTRENQYFYHNRNQQAHYWMHETIRSQLLAEFYADQQIQQELVQVEQKLQQGKMTSFQAAEKLLAQYKSLS